MTVIEWTKRARIAIRRRTSTGDVGVKRRTVWAGIVRQLSPRSGHGTGALVAGGLLMLVVSSPRLFPGVAGDAISLAALLALVVLLAAVIGHSVDPQQGRWPGPYSRSNDQFSRGTGRR